MGKARERTAMSVRRGITSLHSTHRYRKLKSTEQIGPTEQRSTII